MQNGEARNHDIITGKKTRKLYGQDGASRKNITGEKRKIEVNIMTCDSQYDDNRKTVTGKNFEQAINIRHCPHLSNLPLNKGGKFVKADILIGMDNDGDLMIPYEV